VVLLGGAARGYADELSEIDLAIFLTSSISFIDLAAYHTFYA